MANPVPILLGAGIAAALMSGKKKRRKSRVGEACSADSAAPTGYICDNGALAFAPIEEEDLEVDAEPSGEEAGDFEMREEDVTLGAGEEAGSMEIATRTVSCDEFLQAIHVTPVDAGELPINEVAAQETALPAMKAVMTGMAANLGKPLDGATVGPLMVRQALEELVPACAWSYDEGQDDFTYDGGQVIQSNAGKEVLYALMSLASALLDEFNGAPDMPKPGFSPAPQQPGMNIQGG